jgi:hypothetical protein
LSNIANPTGVFGIDAVMIGSAQPGFQPFSWMGTGTFCSMSRPVAGMAWWAVRQRLRLRVRRT